MADKELVTRVLNAVRGDNEKIRRISEALLSHDEARIKQVFSQVASVQLSDDQVRQIARDYSTPERIAAGT